MTANKSNVESTLAASAIFGCVVGAALSCASCIPTLHAEPEPLAAAPGRAAELASYRANVAALESNAHAEPSLAELTDSEDLAFVDDETFEEVTGCAKGTVPWQRDVATKLCATVCSTDQDCAKDARCRLIRTGTPSEPAFIDDVESKDGDVGLCDPYFEEVEADALTTEADYVSESEEAVSVD